MTAKSGSFWKNVDVGGLNLSVRIVQQINILLNCEYVHLPRNESCQICPTIQWGNLDIVWKFWNYRWKKHVELGGGGMLAASRIFLEKTGETSIIPVFPERYWNNGWKTVIFQPIARFSRSKNMQCSSIECSAAAWPSASVVRTMLTVGCEIWTWNS